MLSVHVATWAQHTPPTWSVTSTSHQPSGNRTIRGQADLKNASILDIPVQQVPSWLTGAPFQNGALWVVISASGNVEAFKTFGSRWKRIDITPHSIPPGMPPLVRVQNETAELILPPENASNLTHPILLGRGRAIAFINQAGDLTIMEGAQSPTLAINSLPDARLVTDSQERIAVLTGPTSRYRHSVLGDAVEADSITIVVTESTPYVERVITVPDPWVIEGLAPIWADLNGDGSEELIVTLSSQTDGGKIVVYNDAGEIEAEGLGIGRGFRWRNQMAVAPYGSNGEVELSAVLTPHIGGTVEFYRWSGKRLEISASIPGFTSHVIRSRNLDLNITGDFLAINQPALIVPNNARNTLNAIRRNESGAEVALTLPIGSTLSTNPAAVTLPDNQLALAIGRQDRFLRVWLPPTDLTRMGLVHPSLPTVSLHGTPGVNYIIEESEDLRSWHPRAKITLPTNQDHANVHLDSSSAGPRFFRATSVSTKTQADVLSVQVSTQNNRTNFSVEISSPDTGCMEYADWWEVVSANGTLLYRRVLLHDHANEQPFTRSGGPVLAGPDEVLWIRAHMKQAGYGGVAFTGTIRSGFRPAGLSSHFAPELESLPPLPLNGDCP